MTGQAAALTFPTIRYGENGIPLDLYWLMYRGAASLHSKHVVAAIASGRLGQPVAERLPLIVKLHEVISDKLVAGGSPETTKSEVKLLRTFYGWADTASCALTLDSIEHDFLAWADHLWHRQQVQKTISADTAYRYAFVVAPILDEVLQLRAGLMSKVRLTSAQCKKRLGTRADKTNLEHMFAFGHVLTDISDSLSVEIIRGPLPAQLRFRDGQVIEEWLMLYGRNDAKFQFEPLMPPSRKAICAGRRAAYQADVSLRTRGPLANLRTATEMLIFIAQTGMNLAQARQLRVSKFTYQSHVDGYEVRRVYKARRKGEVVFQIFSEYRVRFERYLTWRRTLFPTDEDGLLFPRVARGGRLSVAPGDFGMVKRRCTALGVRFFGPQSLRMMRVNWLARHSGDVSLTAEMAQHSQATLLRTYDQPNHPLASIEISRFHLRTDPALAMPGSGVCIEAVPRQLANVPEEATRPDCISPAGCLFCQHQRDLDSFDHVWSLASYRYLKSLELARYRPPAASKAPHPAAAAVARITSKLTLFQGSNAVRALWVRDAVARIDEEDFHPKWDGFIRLLEVAA